MQCSFLLGKISVASLLLLGEEHLMNELNKRSRKWMVTINNPQTLDESVYAFDKLSLYINKEINCDYYCYSYEEGIKEHTLHIHIFLYFKNARSGNSIKKVFPTAHLDMCKGTNKQIRDYVFKENLSDMNGDKADTRIDGMQFESGECPAEKQGKRSDIDCIRGLLAEGKSPKEILELDFKFYKYEMMIKKAYFDRRYRETPIKRDVKVIVHIGESGSGKSHVVTTLSENETYIYADYSTGGMDFYNGEKILFMDEFRGQIPYNQLLLMLDGYKVPIHARYSNVYSLWDEVHITSVIPPDEWYKNDNIRDTYEQLKRRIDTIVFHWKNDWGFHAYDKDMASYTTYEALEKEAKTNTNPDLFNINGGKDIIFAQTSLWDYM